jgi:hypothetical protein
VTHRASRGLVVYDRFDDVCPRDARPLEVKSGPRRGRWVGLRVRGTSGEAYKGGQFDVVAPHALWFAGESEYGSYWGRPRMAGAHEPWLEKRGKGGATDSRKLWFKKCAFRGGVMYHPVGKTEYTATDGSTVVIENEDLARQIVEQYENGGV